MCKDEDGPSTHWVKWAKEEEGILCTEAEYVFIPGHHHECLKKSCTWSVKLRYANLMGAL